jgi:hypothetical protein
VGPSFEVGIDPPLDASLDDSAIGHFPQPLELAEGHAGSDEFERSVVDPP